MTRLAVAAAAALVLSACSSFSSDSAQSLLRRGEDDCPAYGVSAHWTLPTTTGRPDSFGAGCVGHYPYPGKPVPDNDE